MIVANENEADAVSVLGYVGVSVLFVKGNVVVHYGGSLVNAGNKISVM